MSEGPTERETTLAARVKELEDAARASLASSAQGGIFEEIWRAVNKMVPPWLAIAALAVFLGHHAFGFYMGAQVTQAETELKQAKADVEKAKADALNSPAGQELVRLAELKAELGVLRNQAALARAKADAASTQSGYATLAKKEAVLKVALTEIKAASDRAGTAILYGGSSVIKAICEGNQIAKELGCPEQYIQQATQAPEDQAPAPQGQQTQPVSATTGQLRTPASFNCANALLGSDFVICASPELLDAEARLEDAYKAAHASGGDNVRSEQYAWIRRYGPDCGLPLRGRPETSLIASARQCVFDAITKRIAELQGGQ